MYTSQCGTRVLNTFILFQLKPYVTANAILSEKLEKRFMKGRKRLMGKNYLRMLKLRDLKLAQQQAAILPRLLQPVSM